MLSRKSLSILALFVLAIFLICPIAAQPSIGPGGVVNAADYTHAFAPGSIISIFGTQLATQTALAETIPLPLNLLGSRVVVVDGDKTLSAPLFFVSAGQINAQLPAEITGSEVAIQVHTASGVSNQIHIDIADCAPRLFTVSMDGEGEAVLLHTDYQVVSEEYPASAGEWVVLYLAGMGEVNPSVPTGLAGGDGAAAGPLSHVTAPVQVRVNGELAELGYAGLAPYFVGLYQVNFRLPENVRAGSAKLRIRVADTESQIGVSFACGPNGAPLTSAIVGPAGGAIAAGGASIQIAPGALAEDTSLALFSGPFAVDFPDHAQSNIFLVRGLPDDLQGSLGVTLPLRTPLVDGTSVTFVVEESGGDTTHLPATVANGSVSVQLRPNASAQASTASKMLASTITRRNQDSAKGMGHLLLYVATTIRSRTVADGVFELYWSFTFPQSTVDDAIAALENAYLQMRGWGFDIARLGPLPVEVSIARGLPVSLIDGGIVRRSRWNNKLSLRIKPYVSDDWPRTSGSERLNYDNAVLKTVCHLAQAYFDRISTLPVDPDLNAWSWLHEAMAVWVLESSGSLADPREYQLGHVYGGSPQFVLRGLQYPAEWASSASLRTLVEHATGVPAFLQFLADSLGDADWLRTAYEAWSPTNSALDALLDARPDLSLHWKQFCRHMMENRFIYRPLSGGIVWSGDALLRYPHMEYFRLSDAARQNGVEAAWNAPDMSAAIYTFEVDSTPLPDGVFTLELSGDAQQCTAYLYRGRLWSGRALLGSAEAGKPLRIADLEAQLAGSNTLRLLLVNTHAESPYNSRQHIQVRARFVETNEFVALLQTANSLQIAVEGEMQCSMADHDMPTYITCPKFLSGINSLSSGHAPMVWTETPDSPEVSSTATITYSEGKGSLVTTLFVQLSEDGKTVEEASLNANRTYIWGKGTENEYTEQTTYSANLRDLPLMTSSVGSIDVHHFVAPQGTWEDRLVSASWVGKLNGQTVATLTGIGWKTGQPVIRVTFMRRP